MSKPQAVDSDKRPGYTMHQHDRRRVPGVYLVYARPPKHERLRRPDWTTARQLGQVPRQDARP